MNIKDIKNQIQQTKKESHYNEDSKIQNENIQLDNN